MKMLRYKLASSGVSEEFDGIESNGIGSTVSMLVFVHFDFNQAHDKAIFIAPSTWRSNSSLQRPFRVAMKKTLLGSYRLKVKSVAFETSV